MLLTLTVTATPDLPDATDLGYLLHKHPQRAQQFDLTAGEAHVFYPAATPERCTAALLVEVDPVALVKGRRGQSRVLGQYVNDRSFAASSLLAVAIGRVFGTAMAGRCDSRPELTSQALPLQVEVPAVPGGPDLVRRLFDPLGWQVTATPLPLDPTIEEWGDSDYVALTLGGELTVAAALSQLYVLLPVLDGSKHYWVAPDEVDKLLRAGGDWLPTHPDRQFITERYLARQRSYVVDATARLAPADDAPDVAENTDIAENTDEARPRLPTLARSRREAMVRELLAAGARRVVDVGCGEGLLLRELLQHPAFTEVVGMDVSHHALERAEKLLGLERMPDQVRERLSLLHGSLMYRDDRLTGVDAMVLMEVIEHVDPPRLSTLQAVVFGQARPRTVLVSTPNVEYNPLYPGLAPGAFRHRDHRFEWTREEFAAWADQVCSEHGYTVRLEAVGPVDPGRGSPTQLAVFTRDAAQGGAA